VPANPYYWSAHWRSLRQACLQRDRHTCVVAGCGSRHGLIVDHIQTRPNVPYPTAADVITNLRTLCATHDAQIKEHRGARKQGGLFRIRGCDANGWPLDPAHGGTVRR
jgi:5-methylcytosine-specific restriction endonuclease McrA